MRKMVSIALSMMLYPKPWDWKYGAGAVSTTIGLYALYSIKRRKYLAAGGGSMEAAK
jgi:adenosine 3'-phospho 5'-phosphosulfate transporter B3